MRRSLTAMLCLTACAAAAQSSSTDPAQLLDRLTGRWVLTGTIAGKPTTHDVEAHWVLRREYLELHEVSREKTVKGDPAYEAIVLVSWEPEKNEYACLWLDSTAGHALSSQTTCRAAPSGDSIPFLFSLSPAERIHTTFTFRRATDSWQWVIDDENNGKTERFADVTLRRAR